MKENLKSEMDISKKVADIHEEIQPALYEYNENTIVENKKSILSKLKSYYDLMITMSGKSLWRNGKEVK